MLDKKHFILGLISSIGLVVLWIINLVDLIKDFTAKRSVIRPGEYINSEISEVKSGHIEDKKRKNHEEDNRKN